MRTVKERLSLKQHRSTAITRVYVSVAGAILAFAFIAALTASLLTTSAFADSVDDDVKLTWSHAWVIWDAKGCLVCTMSDQEAKDYFAHLTGKHPVLLYLHGSDGSKPPKYARFLIRQGFIAIAPNSFARPRFHSNKGHDDLHYRMPEIEYALEELHKLPWVDQSRIVVHGQSQGAWAVAAYEGGGFAAAILTGINCHAYGTNNIFLPKDIPILSLQDPVDPEYVPNRGTGTCADEIKDRGQAKSYVIEMPGFGHVFLGKPKFRYEVNKFLKGLGILPIPHSAS